MQLLDGSLKAKDWFGQIQPNLIRKGLGILIVGDDPASHIYVKLKIKKAQSLGVVTNTQLLPHTASMNEVITAIQLLNNHPAISGVLVQLPLPEHLKPYTRAILDSISFAKDVDVLSSQRLSKILTDRDAILPATPTGILRLLTDYNIPVRSAHIALVGTSLLVGTPLAIRLEQLGATVILCNKYTRELQALTNQADILISAAGKPGLITKHHVKRGAVVVDVGTTKVGNAIMGDIDFAAVSPLASYITPNPGGVGPMTIAALFKNLSMVDSVGFEPTTSGLKGHCSTPELQVQQT